MEVPPIHPGPCSDALLSLQGDHRSAHIWEGELLTQTFRARRVDDMWDFLHDRVLHARVVARLRDTGFYRMIEIGRLQLDWPLVTALIERWRPETHTFHLPIGEATVTLQDVEVLYGLPVDGLPVALPPGMREMSRVQYMDLLHPEDENVLHGTSRFPLTTIRLWLEALHPQIDGDTSDYHVDRYTRLLLLLLFGGVLFPNTSGNLVSLKFLHYLERLDDLPRYSWGSAVLAYLYRHMCRASMGTQRDVAGFLPLLQVWVWERFLQLQPPIPPLGPDVPLELLPLARRWVLRRGHTRHNLSLCRDILDLLDGTQFIWTPYSDTLIAGLPDYCSAGRCMWGSSVPLFCLDIVEHHATERVLRQFGRPQLVPTSPTWEATHYQRDDRTRVDDQYLAWLQDQIFTWDQRLELIPPPPSQSQDTEHDYLAWYRGVTRLFVGNPIHRAGNRYVPYAGRHEALAIGLHLVHQLGLQMQQHAGDPAVALQEYGRQVTELAARTLYRAREDERLEHVPAYVAPEHYHRGKPVPRARGRRGRAFPRGSGAPRGRGGRRGGPQQRGVETPDEDVGADMPGYLPQPDQHPSNMLSYSLQLALIPATSQVTPLDPSLITGTSIIGD